MNNCGCDCNSIELPIGPKGDPGTNGTNGTNGINGINGQDGTNGTNGTNGRDGVVLLLNDTATIVDNAVSGGVYHTLRTFTIPPNTLVNNGDMLKVEYQFDNNLSEPGVWRGWFKIDSLVSYLRKYDVYGVKDTLYITKTSSNTVTIETEGFRVLPYGTLTNPYRYKVTETGFDFTSSMNISLFGGSSYPGHIDTSLFRITKYTI